MTLEIKDSRLCSKCLHKVMIYDEAFIVNGEHYYCDAIDYEDGEYPCIDGFWYEPEAECPCYLRKE